MLKKYFLWLSALVLPGYALACLILIFFLTQNPLYTAPSPVKVDPEISDLSGSTQLPDFQAIDQTPERKRAFTDMLLPMIEQKNNYILKNRKSLIQMKETLAQEKKLTEKQLTKLTKLRKRYHVTEKSYPETARAIEILLLRADIIPQAMVLAQGALESGWGTSRFAVEANNLFGQWCHKKGCGIVPERRAADATHEVQLFSSVEAALDAYYRNINTHNAYREFRQLRAALRAQDKQLTGTALVAGLSRYSARGMDYVNELRLVIRVNDFENVQLAVAEPVIESNGDAIETVSQQNSI